MNGGDAGFEPVPKYFFVTSYIHKQELNSYPYSLIFKDYLDSLKTNYISSKSNTLAFIYCNVF
jgi:hypothetical protein